jgi:hypothetical protein
MRKDALSVTFAAGLFFLACSGEPASEIENNEALPAESPALSDRRDEDPRSAPLVPVFTPEAPQPLDRFYDRVDWGDPDQVLDTIAMIEKEGGQASLEALGEILQRNDKEETRVEAINTLVFLADEGRVVDHIVYALNDRSPEVRIEAVDAIIYLELIETLPELRLTYYRESVEEVREVLEDAFLYFDDEELSR